MVRMSSAGGSAKNAGPGTQADPMNASVGRLLTGSNEVFGTALELCHLCLTWH